MANNLVEIIFDQFLLIVEKISKKSCFTFDECAFNYRVREAVKHRLLDVLYVVKDECGRTKDVIVTIDITGICHDDLTSCKWIQYLENLAKEFVHDICPVKYVIPVTKQKKCREQPPRWEPFPCKTVTTIIKHNKVEHVPECEVIVEDEIECVEQCVRETCPQQRKVIIRNVIEKPHHCGDYTVLVNDDNKKHHDYNVVKGHKDYNNHQWNKACCSEPKCTLNRYGDKVSFYNNKVKEVNAH